MSIIVLFTDFVLILLHQASYMYLNPANKQQRVAMIISLTLQTLN